MLRKEAGLTSARFLRMPVLTRSKGLCKYRSEDPLTYKERVTLNLVHNKEWYVCSRKPAPLGLYVNSCMGCGPKCKGYIDGVNMSGTTIDQVNRLQEVLDSTPKPGYLYGGGDGILTVGGGKYWPGIYVMIRLARQLGFTGPIEVWYRGDCERVYPQDVEGLGVTFYNVDAMGRELQDSRIKTGNPGSGGWEAKLYAMTHTSLDRVLYLDADAYAVVNPQDLFKLLDTAPMACWRDLPSQRGSIRWAHVWPEGDRGITPVQGGQLLIDRRRAWQAIHVAHYLCQNSDYYFRHMYGDQDAWRVAIAATKLPRLEVAKAEWKAVAFICHVGTIPSVIHRCRSKLYAAEDIPPGKTQYSNPQYNYFPREVEVFDLFAEAMAKRKDRSAATVFSAIYDRKIWGKGSGAGSRNQEADTYIDLVNGLIASKGWASMLDIGSGDGVIANGIRIPVYIGIDVAESQVTKCRVRFPVPGKQFHCMDAYEDYKLPVTDVLVAKDVLHHWPNAWVTHWLDRVLTYGGYKAVLLCQDEHQNHDNQDCALGCFRPLSPTMAPLNRFPFKRIGTINHKAVLLWERSLTPEVM